MTLTEEIKAIFDQHKYTWRISGELQSPTATDIRQTIDRAKVLLQDDDTPQATLEVGRLIIKKTPHYFDIYVHVGEEPLKETI